MGHRRSWTWPALATALLAALFIADLATGDATILSPGYGLAPVLAAAAGGPLATAIAAAAALLAVVAEVVQQPSLTGQGAVRLASLAAISALAWWAALQRERREQVVARERFLGRATEALAAGTDQEQALERIARLSVPELADACAIATVDASGGSTRVAEAGDPALLADFASAPVNAELPLVARGQTLGTLCLASHTRRGRNGRESELAEEVAARCAHALDTAGLLRDSREIQDQLLEAFGLLDVLFDRAPIGLGFWDRDLRFVRVNQRLAEINGVPPEDHVGRTVAEIVPDLRGVGEDQRRVLASGVPLTEIEVSGETPAAMGVRREWTASYWPVRRRGGDEVIGVGAVVFEVTDRRAAERSAREQTARYETLLQALSDVGEGMVVLREGRIDYANDAFVALSGYALDELQALGSAYELLVEDDRDAAQRRVARRLEGQVAPGYRVRMRHREGRTLELELAGVPLEIEGELQLVVVARDVTARARAETEREQLLSQTRFLAEASAAFDEELDEERTLQSLARLSVRELADTCVILLGSSFGRVRRVAAVARDPEDERLLQELNSDYPIAERSAHPLFQVLRSGTSRLVVHDQGVEELGQDERHRKLISAFTMRSSVLVPLSARGRTLGVMALGFAGVVGEEMVALLEDLGRRAALAMDNARLYQERAAAARTLQRSLLPPDLPEIPGMQIAARYVAAGEGNEVGGDFYDCFATGGGDWAVVMGDVCGKGPEAAVVTALARYTMRASATLHSERPSRVLSDLNEAIRRQTQDHRFCTVLYVSLSPAENGVSACVATGGHPLPLVLRADGTVHAAGRPGTLLGILSDPEISTETVELGPGDAMILYTDGVTEASPLDDAFGPDHLASFVAGCAGADASVIAGRIQDAALEIQGGVARDDVAVLVVRVLSSAEAQFVPGGRGVAAQA